MTTHVLIPCTYNCARSVLAAGGGDDGKRRTFKLTRQAIGYRMLQLLQLSFETLSKAQLKQALLQIASH